MNAKAAGAVRDSANTPVCLVQLLSRARFRLFRTDGTLISIFRNRSGTFMTSRRLASCMGTSTFLRGHPQRSLRGSWRTTAILGRHPLSCGSPSSPLTWRSESSAGFLCFSTIWMPRFRLPDPSDGGSDSPGENAAPSRWSIVLLVVNAGWARPCYFSAAGLYLSRAILCGAVFALAACYISVFATWQDRGKSLDCRMGLRVLSGECTPDSRAFRLSFLGCAALAALIRACFQCGGRFPAGPTVRALAIGASCAVGLFSYSLVNYLKFGTFVRLPLKYHVQYTPSGSQRFAARIRSEQPGLQPQRIRLGAQFQIAAEVSLFLRDGTESSQLPRGQDRHNREHCRPALRDAGPLFYRARRIRVGRFSRTEAGLGAGRTWAAAIPISVALFTAVAMSQRYTRGHVSISNCCGSPRFGGMRGCESRRRCSNRDWDPHPMVDIGDSGLTFEYQGERVWGVRTRPMRDSSECAPAWIIS